MARLGITEKILLIIALPLIGLSTFAMWQVRASLSDSALLQLKGHMLQLVQRYAAEISTQMEKAVVIADSTAQVLAVNPTTDVERLYRLLESNLDRLSIVYGSALAYEPGRFPGKRLFSPYVFRSGAGIKERMDIAVDAYDYTAPEWEWWHAPRNERRGIWTEPYLDEGAGNILMVTYSAPILEDKQFIGVATVDIDLSAMHANLNLEGLKETDYVILTNSGHFAYHYRKELIGQSYTKMIEKLGLEKSAYVARQMLSGESGFFEYHHDGTTDWVFYAPVGHFGWSFAVRVNLAHALRLADMDATPVYLWSAVVFIVTVILTLSASRAIILTPLRRLGEGLRHIAQGIPLELPASLGSRQADAALSELAEAGAQVQRLADSRKAEIKALNQALADKTLQLKVSNTRQHALLNAAQNATFVIDPAGEVLATNDKAESLLGCQRDEVVNTSLSHWICAEQRGAFCTAIEVLFRTLETQVMTSVDINGAEEQVLSVKIVLAPIYLPDGQVEGDVIFVSGQQST